MATIFRYDGKTHSTRKMTKADELGFYSGTVAATASARRPGSPEPQEAQPEEPRLPEQEQP